jgi:hypothetical protein
MEDKRTIGVVASGPSATPDDARKLQAICDETIAVNDSYRLFLPGSCDHLYSCDYRWAKWHCGTVATDFEGIWWTQDQQWEVDPAQWGICQLKSERALGLSRTDGVIFQGGNSGYQAVGLAYQLLRQHATDLENVGRIILLGFDMQADGNSRHWFGEHPAKLNVVSNYTQFLASFETIHPHIYGLEIINCTRRTALKTFPCMDLDECADLLSEPAQACAISSI